MSRRITQKRDNSLQDKNFSATFEIRFTRKSRFSRSDNPDGRINMRETQLDRCFKNKDTSNIAVVCFLSSMRSRWRNQRATRLFFSSFFFYTGFPCCILVVIRDNNSASSDTSFRKEKTLETRLSSQTFSPEVSSTRLLVARVNLYLGRFKRTCPMVAWQSQITRVCDRF